MQSVVAIPFVFPPAVEAAGDSVPSTDGAFLASFADELPGDAGVTLADPGTVAVVPVQPLSVPMMLFPGGEGPVAHAEGAAPPDATGEGQARGERGVPGEADLLTERKAAAVAEAGMPIAGVGAAPGADGHRTVTGIEAGAASAGKRSGAHDVVPASQSEATGSATRVAIARKGGSDQGYTIALPHSIGPEAPDTDLAAGRDRVRTSLDRPEDPKPTAGVVVAAPDQSQTGRAGAVLPAAPSGQGSAGLFVLASPLDGGPRAHPKTDLSIPPTAAPTDLVDQGPEAAAPDDGPQPRGSDAGDGEGPRTREPGAADTPDRAAIAPLSLEGGKAKADPGFPTAASEAPRGEGRPDISAPGTAWAASRSADHARVRTLAPPGESDAEPPHPSTARKTPAARSGGVWEQVLSGLAASQNTGPVPEAPATDAGETAEREVAPAPDGNPESRPLTVTAPPVAADRGVSAISLFARAMAQEADAAAEPVPEWGQLGSLVAGPASPSGAPIPGQASSHSIFTAATPLPVQQIAAQLSAALTQSADGATELALSPEELGNVRLRLERDAKHPERMVVHITFERPETLDLFRRHAGELAEALRDAGYAGADIGFGHQGDGAGTPDRGPGSGAPDYGAAFAEAQPVEPTVPRLMAGASLDLRL